MRAASWSASFPDPPDLGAMVLRAVGQIPPGKVATFGDVAAALGDVRAARAIGAVLAEAEPSTMVPGHRLVRADGTVPDAPLGTGGPSRAQLLAQEGVAVRAGAVLDLEAVRFRWFDVEPVLAGLQREQARLSLQVRQWDDGAEPRLAAGLDLAYRGRMAVAALVTMDLDDGKVVEERVAKGKAHFPYVPGYLGYREAPLAKELIEPDQDTVFLIDGHGVLHPRGFGVACHIGVSLGARTIGAAKNLLVGEVDAGSGDITMEGVVKGRRLRSSRGKETYVSVGHRVSLDTACAVCRTLLWRGVPEPLRLAHLLAKRERRTWGEGA